MTKILTESEVQKYYQEALKHNEFIEGLSNYEIIKILNLCQRIINENQIFVSQVEALNNDKPNFEHNLKIVEEAYLGKEKRLELYLIEKLNKGAKSIKKEEDVNLNFYSFLLIENANVQTEIVNKYQGKGAKEMIKILKALESLNLFNPSFFNQKQGQITKMLSDTFAMKGKRSAINQALGAFNDINEVIYRQLVGPYLKELEMIINKN